MYKRLYNFNEHYFDKIDTADKAYWLGFIATDGNIMANSKVGYTLAIEIQNRDIDHLILFGSHINHAKYPSFRKRNNNVALAIHSKIMINDLIKQGIHPNKSFTVKPWNGSQELLPHYRRGAFDGDGGIWSGKDKRNNRDRWDISFTGNEYMVNGFADFTRSHNLYSPGLISPVENIFRITWGGFRSSQSVIKTLLYDKENTCLKRKAILVEKLLDIRPKQNSYEDMGLTKDELYKLYDEYGSWKNVCSAKNWKYYGLQAALRRLNVPLVWSKEFDERK